MQNKKNNYYECLYVSPVIFNLFIISLIWRTTLSKEPMYSIPLRSDYKEIIRKDLNDNLQYKSKDYDNIQITKMDNYYSYSLITTNSINLKERGHILPFNLENKTFSLHLGDFLIYFDFYPQENNPFDFLTNDRYSSKVKITLSSPEAWNRILQVVNKRIINRNQQP